MSNELTHHQTSERQGAQVLRPRRRVHASPESAVAEWSLTTCLLVADRQRREAAARNSRTEATR